MTKIDRRLLEIGYSFLAMVSFIFMGTSIMFLLNVPMTRFHYPLFSLLGLIVLNYIYKLDNKEYGVKKIILYYLSFIGISFALGTVIGRIWDFTVDGRWYHSESILRMVDGWNPVYSSKGNIGRWSYYYSKATWYFSAAATMFIGDLEKSKIYTILFEIIVLLVSVPFFKVNIKSKKYLLPVLGAFLLFLNPVNWAQRMTFYQDAVLGLLIILMIMILFFIWNDKENEYRKINMFALFLAAVFLSNIKFTGLVYASIILFVFLLTEFYRKGKTEGLKFLKFCAISFIFITVVLGFSPYVQNTIEEMNPFYPLIGKDSVDIMSTNTPKSFRNANHLEKFVKSLILVPDNNIEAVQGFEPKNLLEMKDNLAYVGPDARIKGFGILSFIIIPVSILMMFLYMLKKPKEKGYFIMVVVQFLIISVLAKEIWWARYFSFFWIMPVWMTLICISDYKKTVNIIGLIMAGIIVVNGAHYIYNSVPRQIEYSRQQKMIVKELKEGNIESFRYLKVENLNMEKLLNKTMYRVWIRYKLDLPLQGVLRDN